MHKEPEGREPLPPELPGRDVNADTTADRGEGDAAVRKLRYDAPTTQTPRPLYLRSDDKQSDEEAA